MAKNESKETSTWELDFSVSVTLEKETDDSGVIPSVSEDMEMTSAIKDALENAKIDEVGDWKVEDWEVVS